MKHPFRSHILPLFSIGAGGLGFALRLWLFSSVDEKGLLPAGHFADAALYILTALVLGILFLATRQVLPRRMNKNTVRLFCSGAYLLGGLGLLVNGISSSSSGNARLAVLATAACGVGAVVMISMAVLKFSRKRLPYWLPAILTVVLMLCTVAQCQIWGAEPQLQVYFFPLLSSVFLMLTTYYSAVLDAKKASRRWFVFCNQSALFFCCVSLWSDSWLFYLTMAFWMFTGLCSLETQSSEKEEEA